MKEDSKLIYKGKTYDSSNEILFQMWVEEAMEAGFIRKSIYHPEPFVLCERKTHHYVVQKKTKEKDCRQALFHRIVYTPDWWIYWTEAAELFGIIQPFDTDQKHDDRKLLFHRDSNGNRYTVIDVKPPVRKGRNASYRDFGIKAPLVYDIYGICVQSVVCVNPSNISDCFFSHTFAPLDYLYRRKVRSGGYLKIDCKEITLKKFVDVQNNRLEMEATAGKVS